jgi:hypothetical protein
MQIVVANVIRDHVREHCGARRGPAVPRDLTPKRLLNEFAGSPALDEIATRPEFTPAQTARQLVEYARAHLPGGQCSALEAWIDGATFDEIELELGTHEPESGKKFVRAAIATLRRHFATPPDKDV